MLVIENLKIVTRQPILDDFSYKFEEGRLYGIVAVNGSGKTTFFRTITGLKKASKGLVTYDGNRITESHKFVFYFETTEWFDGNLSGRDYLKFVKDEWESIIEVEEVIKKLDIQEFINVPIKKYSLGMKQKILLGMYLISDAKYLIMDEITNALDENNRGIVFDLLIDMRKQGKTVLLSSHYKEDISSLCDVMLQLVNQTFVETVND